MPPKGQKGSFERNISLDNALKKFDKENFQVGAFQGNRYDEHYCCSIITCQQDNDRNVEYPQGKM